MKSHGVLALFCFTACESWSILEKQANRRSLLAGVWTATATLSSPVVAFAAAAVHQTEGIVVLEWNVKDKGGFPMAVNGETTVQKGSDVRISYQTSPNSSQYRTTVYQKTGTDSTYDRLEKARRSIWSVPRALDIGDRMGNSLQQRLYECNLVSADTITVVGNSSRVYYYFDMVNPDYGFVYLFATTIVNQRMYVFLIESSSDNSKIKEDLLRVRASFRVEELSADGMARI